MNHRSWTADGTAAQGGARPTPSRRPGGWGSPRRRPPRRAPPRGRPADLALWLLGALWLFVLIDPQWLLARYGIPVLLRVPLLLFVALAATLPFAALTVKGVARRWTWYPPLLCYMIVATVTVPFAINATVARTGLQTDLLFFTLVLGTAALIDSARRAEILVVGYAVQFFWCTLWGTSTGLISWHPTLSNLDGYGAWMVIGGGMCACMALATDHKRFRQLMILTVALCVVGVVASFARGAFLAAIAVGGIVWLRSPGKKKALLGAVTMLLVVVVASTVLHGAEYWEEMATIAEGTSEATGEERWESWKAAFGVFLERPVFGVGFDNWGIYASNFYRPGDLGGSLRDNPTILWGRSTHNMYIRILAEHGLAGVLTFAWILVDFWRRNIQLRTAAAGRQWARMGGRLRLAPLALGIEAAMVGWMVAAALYSLGGTHWFFTILALNLMLHNLVTRGTPAGARVRRFRHRTPPTPATPV